MAVVSLVSVFLFLPESHTPDPTALQPRRIVGGYIRLLFNAEFMVHTGLCGISLGLIFVFVTGGPFVLQELLGVATEHYGWYQALIVAAFFIGSLLASQLVDRIDSQSILHIGCGVILLGSALLVFTILATSPTALSISACYSVMTFGMAGIFAVGPSLSLIHI